MQAPEQHQLVDPARDGDEKERERVLSQDLAVGGVVGEVRVREQAHAQLVDRRAPGTRKWRSLSQAEDERSPRRVGETFALNRFTSSAR